jgi:hypothetical protein
MFWPDRQKGLGRIVIRLSAGTMLGLVPAGLYGGLAAAIHFAAAGRWDRSPAFALGCLIAGALLGLLGGGVWALSGQGPAPVRRRAAGPLLPRQLFQCLQHGRARTPRLGGAARNGERVGSRRGTPRRASGCLCCEV